MTEFRPVTEDFSVAPQLALEDLARAAAQGFRQVINNRPDGEEPGQPGAAEIGQAATAAGLAYLHIPVRGMPVREQVEAVEAALAGGPTLAFCRSGTRSIMTWALAEALSGRRARDEIVDLCAWAGYDMSGLLR
jgi:uncharacterized protein (TIGR01244 family)